MKELLPPQTQDYRARAREVAEKSVRPVAAKYDRTGSTRGRCSRRSRRPA